MCGNNTSALSGVQNHVTFSTLRFSPWRTSLFLIIEIWIFTVYRYTQCIIMWMQFVYECMNKEVWLPMLVSLWVSACLLCANIILKGISSLG